MLNERSTKMKVLQISCLAIISLLSRTKMLQKKIKQISVKMNIFIISL